MHADPDHDAQDEADATEERRERAELIRNSTTALSALTGGVALGATIGGPLGAAIGAAVGITVAAWNLAHPEPGDDAADDRAQESGS